MPLFSTSAVVTVSLALGQVKAERLLFLDADGKEVTHTGVLGDALNCAIVAQRGDDLSTVYFADNIVDAKSIAIGDSKVNLFVSPHQYDDLGDISWLLEQAGRPGMVAITTDNFLKTTVNELFEKTRVLRDLGIKHIVMARGKLKKDYTHLSINDALTRREEVVGDNFIQKTGIEAPVIEKQRFRSNVRKKLGKAVGFKQDQPVEPARITKPSSALEQPYYVKLSKEKWQALLSYFEAVDRLSSSDAYQDAIQVAEKVQATYKKLASEAKKLNSFSQHINIPNTVEAAKRAKGRLERGKTIGLNDLAGALAYAAIPKLDGDSRKQLNLLGKLVIDHKFGAEFKKHAEKFVKEKEKLMQALEQTADVPIGPVSNIGDAANAIQTGKFNRAAVLEIYKLAKNASQSAGGRTRQQQIESDISRGGQGRGGWSY